MTLKKSYNKRKYFRLWDLLPVLLILFVLAAGVWRLFYPSQNEGYLSIVITVDSKEYCRVGLSEVESPYDLIVPVEDEGEVVVHITPDSVYIKESPCPDKLCVNTGELTKSGQSTVCLPMRVSVSIISDVAASENTPDAVVG